MKFLNLILILLVISSCNVGKEYAEPEMPEISEKDFKELNKERFKTAEPVANWWKNFDDEQLTALVEKALKHNYDIKIALANLRESRAFIDRAELGYFPTITSNAAGNKEKFSNDSLFPIDKQNTYSAGFDAIWELDLFGRFDQLVENAQATAQAQEANLRGTYVSVAAEVAAAYIQLRGAQYRLNVAQQNAENQQNSFELTQTLEEAGRGDMLDIARARTQLELTNSTIPLLEAEVNSSINRLGVLTGQKPIALQEELAEKKPLPSIPESVNMGNVIDLLKRRPDVQAAERQLAVAVTRYNINVVDLYPKVSLVGALGFLATKFTDLGTAGTSTFLYGASIDWAAFNIGRINAQIDAADAVAEAQLAGFEKTVLVALEEIDTNMVNFSRQEKSREKLFEAANASAKAAEFAQDRFDAGIDSFLDVLDAQRSKLEAENRLAQSETQLALYLIAIYKSLGGGWEVALEEEQNAAAD